MRPAGERLHHHDGVDRYETFAAAVRALSPEPVEAVQLAGMSDGRDCGRPAAAAAARRVPSPEPPPQPRKEKKKTVVWVDPEALVGVRWFLKVRTRVGCSPMQTLPQGSK